MALFSYSAEKQKFCRKTVFSAAFLHNVIFRRSNGFFWSKTFYCSKIEIKNAAVKRCCCFTAENLFTLFLQNFVLAHYNVGAREPPSDERWTHPELPIVTNYYTIPGGDEYKRYFTRSFVFLQKNCDRLFCNKTTSPFYCSILDFNCTAVKLFYCRKKTLLSRKIFLHNVIFRRSSVFFCSKTFYCSKIEIKNAAVKRCCCFTAENLFLFFLQHFVLALGGL